MFWSSWRWSVGVCLLLRLSSECICRKAFNIFFLSRLLSPRFFVSSLGANPLGFKPPFFTAFFYLQEVTRGGIDVIFLWHLPDLGRSPARLVSRIIRTSGLQCFFNSLASGACCCRCCVLVMLTDSLRASRWAVLELVGAVQEHGHLGQVGRRAGHVPRRQQPLRRHCQGEFRSVSTRHARARCR